MKIKFLDIKWVGFIPYMLKSVNISVILDSVMYLQIDLVFWHHLGYDNALVYYVWTHLGKTCVTNCMTMWEFTPSLVQTWLTSECYYQVGTKILSQSVSAFRILYWVHKDPMSSRPYKVQDNMQKNILGPKSYMCPL